MFTDEEHIFTDTLNFDEAYAFVLFSGAGLLSLVGFFVLKRLAHLLDDRYWVLISSICGMVGYFVIIDFIPRILHAWRYIIGFTLIYTSITIGRGTILTMFSK
jgi:hypothetical protein